MAKILVTGGAGYIGSHITEMLLKQRHDVVVLDKFYYGTRGIDRWRSHPGITLVEGDICSRCDLAKAMSGVSSVIALAAIVGDSACELSHEETLCTNYESTKTLMEIAKYHKISRIVFASSCSVYGANGSIFLNEDSGLNPVSLYAETRIMSEKYLFSHREPLEVVVLRLATVFGSSARMRFDLVANILVAKALFEGEISICNKDQYRPLVHVQDAARAFVLASQAPSEKVQGQIFNVGTNSQNFTLGEIGEAVQSLIPGIRVHFKEVEDRRDYRVDFSKIKAYLGFTGHFSLEDGIREMKEFIGRNPQINYLDDIYYNAKYLFRNERASTREVEREHAVVHVNDRKSPQDVFSTERSSTRSA